MRAAELPARTPFVKWKPTGKTGILLNLQTGDYFELDEIATAVWKQLDGKTTVSDVVRKLSRTYSAPAEAVEKDVIRFLSDLRKRKLIDDASQRKRRPPAR